MSKAWPLVKLGEVIRQRKEFITIDDTQEYMRCRVQLHAKGIVLRDRVTGSEIKTKQQQVCQAGEFLVAEIDAKVGGYGIVPDELENSIVSSHYFLFTLDHSKLNTKFLDYYSQTPAFREQVNAKGSTNYAAIRPHEVLNYTIPLPHLAEQQRIVAKIERLAGKIEEAITHKKEIVKEYSSMLHGIFNRLTKDSPMIEIEKIAPLIRRAVNVCMEEEYPELGIKSFGKGTFHKPALNYLSIGNKRLYRIEPGDLVFNNVFAWEGAIAVAQPHDIGKFGSHRFITCVAKQGISTANFICFYLLAPEGLNKIGDASPGGAGRNRTLGLEKLAKIQIPLPDYKKQLYFDRLHSKVKNILSQLKQTENQLNAMLPSILDKAFKGKL